MVMYWECRECKYVVASGAAHWHGKCSGCGHVTYHDMLMGGKGEDWHDYKRAARISQRVPVLATSPSDES